MTQDKTVGKRISAFILSNIVTIVFIIFAIVGYIFSGDFTPSSFTNELAIRFFRNALLIISLIIPVIAGLGLNFGIVVGALVGMLSIIIVRYNMLAGHLTSPFGSLMLCFLIALPMAILVGWLVGRLYNKTRGQEMVASLMVGYFAEGIYMVILLFVIGGLIPVAPVHPMINTTGMGIRATFDMGLPAAEINLARGAHQVPGMSRALTGLWRVEFLHALIAIAAIALIAILCSHCSLRSALDFRHLAIDKSR
jgi:simple sugar transport system permease protein